MEEKFKNLINTIKRNKLTFAEKSEMLKKINSFIDQNKGKKHSPFFYYLSPFVFRSPFVTVGKIVSMFMLIFVVGGGSLSYASSKSLPGDFLYPVKIHIKEKIEEKLAIGPEKKLALRQKRINIRFGEVETLIKEKKITKEKLFLVQSKIEKEKEKATENLKELKKENTEKALIVENIIETSIEGHKNTISSMIEPKKEGVNLVITTPIEDGTDFYGDTKNDLDITEEDLNILLNSDSNVGEKNIPPLNISPLLEITDVKVVPKIISNDVTTPTPTSNTNIPTNETQQKKVETRSSN